MARQIAKKPTSNANAVVRDLVSAWRDGSFAAKAAITISVVFMFVGFGLISIGQIFLPEHIAFLASQFCLSVGALTLFFIGQVQRAAARDERLKQIRRLEARVERDPNQPQAAWDLASNKLESYIDRNLGQVASIFWLTLVVMFLGFVLIGVGVWLSLKQSLSPKPTLTPAMIASLSGILTQFIAATFLIIYRSTIEQSKSYVTILERINAVGMSLQVLNGIEGDDVSTRNAARAELTKDLLQMYRTRSGSQRTKKRPKQ